jgi:hypothetical protein
MSNIIEEVGHGLKAAGKDIVKGIEYPFVHTAQFCSVIATLIKEESPVKDAVIALVKDAEAVDVDAVAAIGSKGLNIPADIAVFKDVVTFFNAFRSEFLPVVAAAFKELQGDIK